MKFKVVLLTMALLSVAKADTIKVGVVDTGFDFKSKWDNVSFPKPRLCKFGHKDFGGAGPLTDEHGHGTHIISLIGKYADNTDYCIVSAKYYSKPYTLRGFGIDNGINSTKALRYLVNLKVDIINLSYGGTSYIKEECDIIKKALDNGIIIVAAAGNDREELKNSKKYYPALCDNRVVVVSNLDYSNKSIALSANYNDDMVFVTGTDMLGLAPNNLTRISTGSSESTAVYTGKLVKLLGILRNRK